MDNYAYLQQISKSNRPIKKPTPHSFPNLSLGLILKILVGGIIATAILIAIGIIINASPSRATDLTQQLYTRMTNVNNTISEYNKSLKSSQLRSINYSLSGTLTGTLSQLDNYITSTTPKGEKPAALPTKLADYETALSTNINNALSGAKLNGILDRIYAAQIHMQVSLMLTMTSELLQRDQDPALHEILDTFYSNLNIIEQTLNNYNST